MVAVTAGCQQPTPSPWHRTEFGDEPLHTAEVSLASVGAISPRLRGGSYRVLRLRPGVARGWDWTPTADAYFSTRPLRSSFGPCEYRYRITALDAANGVELQRLVIKPESGDVGARNVVLDLAAHVGRPLRLVLQTDLTGDDCTPAVARTAPPALWASPALYQRQPAKRPPGTQVRPNIILLSMDALRADALGMGGRDPSLSPALDRLALESDVWPQAFATFNVTNPSFASIFTGLYGKRHGVYDLKTPLPPHHPTLAGLLRKAGYKTQALIAAHHLNDQNSGLGRGFDGFTVAERQWAAEHATDQAINWLLQQEQTFFLWLHLFDPHTPHRPPGRFAYGEQPIRPFGLSAVDAWTPFRETGKTGFSQPRLAAHRDLYDGEVAYLDRQVDRLLGFLSSRRLLERTLLIVLADHGENAGEQGIQFRHAGLWDATTRVPLLIRWPGASTVGRRLSGLAQTIDVMPTVLGYLGLNVPPVDGTDLGRTPTPGRRYVYAEHQGALGAMIRNTHLLYSRQQASPVLGGGRFLFDMRRDPHQQHNLIERRPEIAAHADRLLDEWLADRTSPAPSLTLDEEERERLRALGYVDP